ncbi:MULTISPECIES: hypothetical protein [Pedobacter]|uniref:Pentapeptide MXKDX repeat protein n=1 Tax=Pedobacter zeae TaxID=1737356 RepID=A0A7W6K739_9SPHI|nr:hypothetical protein [Pedobacter zeae]MBB4106424.1 pentapeptide MXKDX repeat protein [Pedobacter zeae]GGH01596.1 hypothetical protein GCM10007422_15490 [Pedobacter zeae]
MKNQILKSAGKLIMAALVVVSLSLPGFASVNSPLQEKMSKMKQDKMEKKKMDKMKTDSTKKAKMEKSKMAKGKMSKSKM